MPVRIQKTFFHIDLDITSAILSHCGTKGLLAYISYCVYKDRIGDKYATPEELGHCSLLKNIKEFTSPLLKLQEMGLIVKKGNRYISTTKTKRWMGFVSENYEHSLEFGGILILKLDELYAVHVCPIKHLEEHIYFTITNAVRKGKSLSRGFMARITGLSPSEQIKLEKKYKDDIVQSSLYMPLNGVEREKITHIPFMKGRINFNSNKPIEKSENFRNSCTVVQLGNTMAINPSLCHGFLNWKKARKKRESLLLNEPVQRRGEVCDWDSFYATLDLSMDKNDRTKRVHDFINIKDKRYKTWEDFKKKPYHAINVINKKGDIVNLRDHLRRFNY